MANRFLKDVGIAGQVAQPNFIRSNIDTGQIQKAVQPTSGSKMVDMAFDTAIKISSNLEEARRAEEKGRLDLRLSEELAAVESQFAGVDKYSEANFSKYQEAIAAVHVNAKNRIGETKFLTKTDLDSINTAFDKSEVNTMYRANAGKAEYDIKETISNGAMTAMGLYNRAAIDSNEERSIEMMANASRTYYESVKNFMPESQVRENLVKMYSNAQTERMRIQTQEIMNSDRPIEQKRDMIEQIELGLKEEGLYLNDTTSAFKALGYKGQDLEAISGLVQNQVYENYVRTNGIKTQLNNEITNQQFREEQLVKDTKAKLVNNYNTLLNTVNNGHSRGNYLQTINKLEDTALDPQSFMENKVLQEKYFGTTITDAVERGEFIQIYTDDERAAFKYEIDKSLNDGATWSTAIQDVIDEIDSYETEEQKENALRSISGDKKSISRIDYDLAKIGDTKTLDNRYLGSKRAESNAIVYGQMPVGSPVRDLTSGLNGYQTLVLNQILVGEIVSGQTGWSGQVKLNARTFNDAYKRNSEFAASFNKALEVVKNIPNVQVSEYKPPKQNFVNSVNEKTSSTELQYIQDNRVKTQTIERQSYTDSVFN